MTDTRVSDDRLADLIDHPGDTRWPQTLDVQRALRELQQRRAIGDQPAVPEGCKLVPMEPCEAQIAAYMEAIGPIVGTPETLAKPEFVGRMKASRRKAAVTQYKAMLAASPDARG